MEAKTYLKEADFPMPAKTHKPTDAGYLCEIELESYMKSIEVLRPWETLEVNKETVGVPALVIKVDKAKLPKGETDRTDIFFNVIQYKFSCDIKNGKLGKKSLANFKTYVKGIYSYSYPAFVLEKLKKANKEMAKKYAEEFKAELEKLYTKKINSEKTQLEKLKAEIDGTVAESKSALAKIKA
ncbi:MAG: hypothetical protein FWC00_04000 [Firmicutes bacterium]|nr:hypothetical protein [Bacillota bacterium]